MSFCPLVHSIESSASSGPVLYLDHAKLSLIQRSSDEIRSKNVTLINCCDLWGSQSMECVMLEQ